MIITLNIPNNLITQLEEIVFEGQQPYVLDISSFLLKVSMIMAIVTTY